MFLSFLFKKHRHHINWNQILWGFTVQLLFGIFVLQTIIGRSIFQCIGDKINTFLSFTKSGTEMVFGYLSNGQLLGTIAGNYTLIIGASGSSSNIEMMMNDQIQVQLPSLPLMVQSSIFALSGMPVIIFFSFFVSILYYYGIMQIIVNKFGHLLQTTIGTTACESISASGNIFLGMVIFRIFIQSNNISFHSFIHLSCVFFFFFSSLCTTTTTNSCHDNSVKVHY